jgi:pyruvate carboxylase
VFRIFDSLNWVDQMKVANEAVQEAGKISEGTICYNIVWIIFISNSI